SALLIEKNVSTPFGSSMSTSKYGSSSVAAGVASMVQMSAFATPVKASAATAAQTRNFLIRSSKKVEVVQLIVERNRSAAVRGFRPISSNGRGDHPPGMDSVERNYRASGSGSHPGGRPGRHSGRSVRLARPGRGDRRDDRAPS